MDHHFTKVFDKSKEVFAITKGFFDPTAGSLVNAYGFGPEQSLTTLTTAVRDSLLNLTGLAKVTLTEEGRVKKTNPNIYLILMPLAKDMQLM